MKLLIKISISLAMLTLALRLVHINELKESLLSIPLPALGMVVVIFFFSQLLSSYKWWLLARSGNIETSWLLAVKGVFPRHGGQLVWAWHRWRRSGSRSRARKQVKTENHRAGIGVCRPSPWDHRSGRDRRSVNRVSGASISAVNILCCSQLVLLQWWWPGISDPV